MKVWRGYAKSGNMPTLTHTYTLAHTQSNGARAPGAGMDIISITVRKDDTFCAVKR